MQNRKRSQREKLGILKHQVSELMMQVEQFEREALEEERAALLQQPMSQPISDTPPFIPPPQQEKPPVVSSQPAPANVPAQARYQPPIPPVQKKKEEQAAEAGAWEIALGGKFALYAGIALVFLASVFFLAWQWNNMTPEVRLGLGFLAGACFMGIGYRSRTRTDSWFHEGMIGASLALFYLNIWAGTQRYALLPFEIAFALMGLTTALGVGMALRLNSQSLSLVAALGGFLTPALLRSSGEGGSTATSLLLYIAILNMGLLAVSLSKRWRAMTWMSFIATCLLMMGWAESSYNDSLRWTTFGFVSLYFVLFCGASAAYSLLHREQTDESDIALLFANAFVYALAGYALVVPVLGDYPGLFPAGLFLFFTMMAGIVKSLAPENRSLSASAAGMAVLFLTLAVPVQLRDSFIPVAWSVEAGVLTVLGLYLGSRLLYGAGLSIWSLSILSILWVWANIEPVITLPFVNERGLPLLASILSAGTIMLARSMVKSDEEQTETLDSLFPLSLLTSFMGTYVVIGAMWLLTQETWYSVGVVHGDERMAQMLISLEWTLLGVVLLLGGIWRDSRAVRLSGLTVLGLTLCKVFLMDLSFLDTPLRVLSFGGLGLSLILISWLYTRYGVGQEKQRDGTVNGV